MGIKKWEINSQIAIAFSFDGKSVMSYTDLACHNSDYKKSKKL